MHLEARTFKILSAKNYERGFKSLQVIEDYLEKNILHVPLQSAVEVNENRRTSASTHFTEMPIIMPPPP